MQFDFEIDGDVQVSRKLLRLGQHAGDCRPVFSSMADDIIALTKKQFDSQGSSGSGGWKPLKDATVAAKARHKPPLDPRILRATGALYKSLAIRGASNQHLVMTKDTLEFGSKLPYSAVHQKGSRSRNIPQRRPVELTKSNRLNLVKSLQRFIITGEVR